MWCEMFCYHKFVFQIKASSANGNKAFVPFNADNYNSFMVKVFKYVVYKNQPFYSEVLYQVVQFVPCKLFHSCDCLIVIKHVLNCAFVQISRLDLR